MQKPLELLERYFTGQTLEILATHGRVVADLALAVGRALELDDETLLFIDQAALLHDIGVCRIHSPKLGLYGPHPYIMHGVLGREIMDSHGLPLHGLVCERHIGVGLNVEDIVGQQLPLPLRDMTPQTLPEEIICFADLFFSKTPEKLTQRKTPDKVREKLAPFGQHKLQIFDAWMERFGEVL